MTYLFFKLLTPEKTEIVLCYHLQTYSLILRVLPCLGYMASSPNAVRTFPRVSSVTCSNKLGTSEIVAMLKRDNPATSYMVGFSSHGWFMKPFSIQVEPGLLCKSFLVRAYRNTINISEEIVNNQQLVSLIVVYS
jgi:hypothetical protein